jgi:hypothetical protein
MWRDPFAGAWLVHGCGSLSSAGSNAGAAKDD